MVVVVVEEEQVVESRFSSSQRLSLLAMTTASNSSPLPPLLRKDAHTLSSLEGQRFANALMNMCTTYEEDTDTTIYFNLASIHERYCQHNSEAFLSWHRLFLILFEVKLREADKRLGGDGNICCPYWNWLEHPSLPNIMRRFVDEGMPEKLRADIAAEGYNSDVVSWRSLRELRALIGEAEPFDGKEEEEEEDGVGIRSVDGSIDKREVESSSSSSSSPPSFLSVFFSLMTSASSTSVSSSSSSPPFTYLARELREAGVEEALRSALGADSWYTMTHVDEQGLEIPHNDVHSMLLYPMRSVALSAFSPLFWLHHAFLDGLVEIGFCERMRRRSSTLGLMIKIEGKEGKEGNGREEKENSVGEEEEEDEDEEEEDEDIQGQGENRDRRPSLAFRDASLQSQIAEPFGVPFVLAFRPPKGLNFEGYDERLRQFCFVHLLGVTDGNEKERSRHPWWRGARREENEEAREERGEERRRRRKQLRKEKGVDSGAIDLSGNYRLPKMIQTRGETPLFAILHGVDVLRLGRSLSFIFFLRPHPCRVVKDGCPRKGSEDEEREEEEEEEEERGTKAETKKKKKRIQPLSCL